MSSSAAIPQQRMQALQRANTIRLARSALKRRVAVGELTAAAVILDPPDAAQGLQIFDLLKAQRDWGARRTRRFCTRHRVTETRPIGALTRRQRAEIAGALR